MEKDWILISKVKEKDRFQDYTEKLIKKLAELGHLTIYESNKSSYVTLNEIVRYQKFLEEVLKDFVTPIEAHNILCDTTYKKLLEREAVKTLEFLANQGVTLRQFVPPLQFGDTRKVPLACMVDKSSLEEFKKKVILKSEAMERYDLSRKYVNKLIEKNQMKSMERSHQFVFLLRKEVEEFLAPLSNRLEGVSIEDFYTREEAYATLRFKYSWNAFENLISLANIATVKLYNRWYFEKQGINELVKAQEHALQSLYTKREVIEMFNTTVPEENIRLSACREEVDRKTLILLYSAKRYDRGPHNLEYCYSKEEIDDLLEEYEFAQIFETLDFSNAYHALEQVLSYKGIEQLVKESNQHTYSEWLYFTKRKLKKSEGEIRNKRKLVAAHIKCLERLLQLPKEVYDMTAKEINLSLLNDGIPINNRYYIYSFLLLINNKSKYDKDYIENNIKTKYKIQELTNPRKSEKKKKKPKEIYPYEEYKQLYDYVKEPIHKERAIIDANNRCNNKENKEIDYYSSTWLYVLIHMNNAWRHGDVMKFPRINYEDVDDFKGMDKKSVLSWIENHDLSQKQANKIINQVIRKDLKVSKTMASNHFYCAEDLIVPLATAAIINEINNRWDDIPSDLKDRHITFGSKNDDNISQKAHTAFFKSFKGNDFVFENRKMNRSILSYLYILLVKKGKGHAALEVAQRLRAHEDIETTNIYIHIPEEELNQLTYMLFKRKHFGYIPYLLLNSLTGETEDRTKRTKEIERVRNVLGSIYGIENSMSHVNTIQRQKQTVQEWLESLSLEETKDLLFNLDANLLPSKKKHVQCILSEDHCTFPNASADFCQRCVFAVPNFYLLSSLAESTITVIEGFLLEVKEKPDMLEAEKIRKCNLFLGNIETITDACQEFGSAEVFKFFPKGKEHFYTLLDELNEIYPLEDMKQLATYQSKYKD